MPERWRSGTIALAVLTLAVALGTGCAQDVKDIDRTQPDKVEKAHFQDDASWYFRQTVVDTTVTGNTGYGIGEDRLPTRAQRPMWTGQVSRKLKRIKWEIHKNVLYARSTVEPAQGVTEQIDGEKHQELGIVAAFPIKSHFDVQRRYSDSTGEPQNVIVENRSDRPWYDREYMRVDWSQNLVTATSSVFTGVTWGLMSPKASTKSARPVPQSEDRIDPGRTEISENVVNATSEYVFDPDPVGCIASLGADSVWRCEGGTTTVRNYFWRVDARKEHRYGDSNEDGTVDEDFEASRTYYDALPFRDDVAITKNKQKNPLKSDSGTPLESTSGALGGEILSTVCNKSVNETNRSTYAAEPDERCNQASFGLFSRFGFFRTNVANWNEKRHTYDSGRIQYANRWNIWQTMYDEEGNLLPLKKRRPEPIVYHLNAGYPKEMMPMAEKIEKDWDRTFKRAVAVAKDIGVSKVSEQLEASGHPDGQMFIIEKNSCHPSKLVEWKGLNGSKRNADRRNPNAIFSDYVDASGDQLESALWDLPVHERKRLCEELEWATERRSKQRFEWQQRGEFKYSFFAWVRELNTGWLGYGPSSADPTSGEIISGTANFAGRLLPLIANEGADIIKYVNGEYSRDMIERGLHVRKQLAGSNSEGSGSSSNGEKNQQLEPAFTEGRDRRVVDAEVPVEDRPRIDISKYKEKLPDERDQTGKTPVELGRTPEFVNEAAYREIAASSGNDAYDGRIVEWLERPEVKKRLMSNPRMSQAVKGLAVERGGAKGAEDSDRVHRAYLALNAPMLLEKRMENRQRLLRKNNVFSSRAASKMMRQLALMTGAAKRFKGAKHEKIAEYLRDKAFYGTQLHELGHTFGLRHNFSASLDAMNYHDEFWKIETLQQAGCGSFSKGVCSDGKLTAREARRGGQALAKKILGNKRDEGYISKAEYRLASIMDYTAPPRLVGRAAGLGKYDQAAITFAYGRHVQQFEQNPGLPNDLSIDMQLADYFKFPAVFGDEGQATAPRNACVDGDGNLERDCMKRGVRRMTQNRKWVSIKEAIDHKRRVLQQNGRAFTKVHQEGMQAGNLSKNNRPTLNRIVPYRFCTDDREGRSLGCQAFDWGSNQFEVAAYAIQEFKMMQPFSRYRGAAVNGRSRLVRLGGLQNEYAYDILNTLSITDTPFRYFSFYDSIDLSLGAATDDVESAARLGLNFYGDLLSQPKPGRYCYYDESDNVDPRFNINEKTATPNGLFVPDDVYWRDRKLGECQKEIARIHGLKEQTRYALKLSANKSSWNNPRSFTVSYTPSMGDTASDVATELKTKAENKLSNNSDLSSLTVRRVNNDVVLESFGSYDSYGFEPAGRDEANGEKLMSTMSSPHSIEKGTGEYFGFNFSPEYNYRINRVGTYIDKLVAGSRLFQLSANFTFQEFTTDVRAVNISYWTEFPDQLYRMIHGMFLGDFRRFGGGYSPSAGAYKRWNLVDYGRRDQDGDGKVDEFRGEGLAGGVTEGMPRDTWAFMSPHSFSTRNRLILYAIAEFSTIEDKRTDFDEYTIIAATEQERQNLPNNLDPSRRITFVHPTTNRKYVAIAAQEGDGPNARNRSITYDLLEWANRVKKKYENASTEPGPREDVAPKTKYREDLENIVSRINYIRQIRAYFFREG